MAYVDLNPIRAEMASTIEESEFTSIYERIHSVACQQDTGKGELPSLPSKGLVGFFGNERKISSCSGMDFSLLDYFALVESLGYMVRPNKRGYIKPCQGTILDRLGMSTEQWLKLSENFGDKFRCAVGTVEELERYAIHTNRVWVSGKCQMVSNSNTLKA